MAVIRPGLFAVIERFPHCRDDVRELFKENDSFQTLCEDYWKCTEALRHWNQSSSKEAVVRRKEYSALLRDLEAEILETLTKKLEPTRHY